MKNKFIVLIVFCSILILAILVSATNSEWTNFMYNNTRSTNWITQANPSSNISSQYANYTTGNSIRGTPSIFNGSIYIGNNEGILYQLNASNVTNLIASYATGGVIEGGPTAYGGFVYVGSYDGLIYQLNATNVSQLIASYTTPNVIPGTPLIANDCLYIGSYDGKFYQLNATNISNKIAEYNHGSAFYASPIISGDYVYAIGNGKLLQLNATNISNKIADYSGAFLYSSPAVSNGFVYAGSYDGWLYQLNASNVSQLINSHDSISPISSPAISNGYVYAVSTGRLLQLNATNISIEYSSVTIGNSQIDSSPSISNGYVYIGGDSFRLHQLNATNISNKIANYTTGNSITGSPIISEGFVYLGSYDSVVYQLNASWISGADLDAPTITIIEPTSKNYNLNESLNLNYSANENISTCIYNIKNSTNDFVISNTTITSCGNTTFNLTGKDDDYVLTLFANDTLGNLGSSSVSFGVTMSFPSVVLNAPINNYWTQNGSDIYFNFTGTYKETGLDTCQLWGNFTGTWKLNYTWIAPTNATMNYTILNLTNGRYIWNVYCNESLGNGGWALANRTIGVDNEAPTIDKINNPNGTKTTTPVTLDVNVSDNLNLETCYYNVTSGGTTIIGLGLVSCSGDFAEVNSSFGIGTVGTYSFWFTAIDSAGNKAYANSSFVFASSGDTAGGGGSSTIITTNISSGCGNGVCDGEETYLTCPLDCQSNLRPITDCFGVPAGTESECIFGPETTLFWIFLFVIAMFIFSIIFNKKKQKKSYSFLPEFGRKKK